MPTNADVTISYVEGGKLTVEPDPATISTQGQVSWDMQIPAGWVALIDFTGNGSEKGPFPSTHSAGNPSRGVYEGTPSVKVASNRPDKGESPKPWKYDVTVRNPGGKEVSVDPGVVIDGNP